MATKKKTTKPVKDKKPKKEEGVNTQDAGPGSNPGTPPPPPPNP